MEQQHTPLRGTNVRRPKLRVSRQQKKKRRRDRLKALLAAALAIPGIGLATSTASAQSVAEAPEIRFFYADYQEGRRYDDRMRVKEPIVWMRTPLVDEVEFEGSFTVDSISGASPLFLNTLTGASGLGVEDVRHAGDFKFTKYFENFSVGAGGVFSSEDDYLSRGAVLDARVWTPDKNTTFAFGVSVHDDDITSSIAPDFRESRTTYDVLWGVTQVINPVSIIQTNITFSTGDGYFADPYKAFDNRPRSREQWALLNRYNLYLPSLDSSLHADYRIYRDTWSITSHMLEVAWYKPLGTSWLIRPSIRYYTQSAAYFFEDVYPPDDINRFMTFEQRLSGFGSVTLGLKVVRELPHGFSIDCSANYLQQKPEYKLGGGESSVIVPFDATFFTVGMSKKF